MRSVPATVQVGARFRVRGRVVNLPRNRRKTARLTFTLRKSARATRFTELRTVKLRRPRRGTARNFNLRIEMPDLVRAGSYTFRACVRRSGSEGKGSCRSKRLRVTDKPVPGPGPGPTPPGPTPPGPGAEALAKHSLRAPLTGENFYFVMADRFWNGDTTNDKGGIDSTDPDVHGFDDTKKGYFHGGDLKGLLDKIEYIEDLGTTAIWLTPSFKNRPVQGPPGSRSAGYHGYWVTDFEQIDPHFGTNAELRALIDEAHERGMKVFFDIITNHTADVISYDEEQYAYVSKDREPYRTAAGTPFDDRDFAGTDSFPALSENPNTSFPLTPENNTGIEKVPSWLNDETLYHNRGDTTFTGEDSLYGDFFGLDDLFTEHPQGRQRHGRHLQEVDQGDADRRVPHRHHEARQRRVLAEVLARGAAVREGPGHPRVLHVRRGRRRHAPRSRRTTRPRTTSSPCSTSRSRRRRARSRRSRRPPTGCATSSATTTTTPTRTRTPTSCRRSSATTTPGTSGCSCATTTRRGRRSRSCWRATSSRTS